jgi:hypothetical protein
MQRDYKVEHTIGLSTSFYNLLVPFHTIGLGTSLYNLQVPLHTIRLDWEQACATF